MKKRKMEILITTASGIFVIGIVGLMANVVKDIQELIYEIGEGSNDAVVEKIFINEEFRDMRFMEVPPNRMVDMNPRHKSSCYDKYGR